MRFVFVILCLLFSTHAWAQSSEPVEISADEALEWDRTTKTYTAIGNVLLKQGQIQLQADKLTAYYTDNQSMSDITTLEATGNVIITSAPYVATGDKAIYDVRTGNATLTGRKMTVTTEKDVMTVDKKIQFFAKQNKLIAHGNPTIRHQTDIIRAQLMTAYFERNAAGKLVADRVTATGGVSIATEKEVVTGQEAVYYYDRKQAVLSGGVRVKQGENWLAGDTANVDLTTGVSQLVSQGKQGQKGRVTGVFYPKSVKKDEGQ